MSAVGTGQVGDMVFVKESLLGEYRTKGCPVFTASSNRSMDGEGNLRVRDDGRKKESVGTSTVAAANPCDTQGKGAVHQDDFRGIAAIPHEAAGMAAGTGDEGEIKGKNRFIIKILGKKVVVFCFNGYHKY